jgi:hypothetical protein
VGHKRWYKWEFKTAKQAEKREWKRDMLEPKGETPYGITFGFYYEHFGTYEQIAGVKDRIERELNLMLGGVQHIELQILGTTQIGEGTETDT